MRAKKISVRPEGDVAAVCPVCGRTVDKIRLMRVRKWVYVYAFHKEQQELHQLLKVPKALWRLIEDYVVAARCR